MTFVENLKYKHLSRQVRYKFVINKMLLWAHGNDERIKMSFKKIIEEHFPEIVADDTIKIEEYIVKSPETRFDDIASFVGKAMWYWKNLPGWFDDVEKYSPLVYLEVDIPDGTMYFVCSECKSIINARNDYEEILDPMVCPHCAKTLFEGYESPWTYTHPSHQDYQNLRKFVDWEIVYWSDGPRGKFLRWRVSTWIKIRYFFMKTFNTKSYREAKEKFDAMCRKDVQ